MSIAKAAKDAHVVPASTAQELLNGAFDTHCHCMMMRGYRWNLIELAQEALKVGMRIVLKNRYGSSAELAYLVNKFVGSDVLIGSVVLNGWMGGLNPPAVRDLVDYAAGLRVVEMPTWYALNNLVKSGLPTDLAIRIFDKEELTPEAEEIINIVADKNLVLKSGHLSAEEAILLTREATKLGVKKILVTHATLAPVNSTLEQELEMVKEGAFIEYCFAEHMPGYPLVVRTKFPRASLADTEVVPFSKGLEEVRKVGPEHIVLGTDFGQETNPTSVEGIKLFIHLLLEGGIPAESVKRMAQTNPGRLLGYDAKK